MYKLINKNEILKKAVTQTSWEVRRNYSALSSEIM